MAMKKMFCLFLILLNVVVPGVVLHAQAPGKGLFDEDSILDITLSGNLKELMNDRAEESKFHPLSISYFNPDSSLVTIPITSKTRGHFRKQAGVCTYPPLLLHFEKNETVIHSVFKDQVNLKLVMPCSGDEYVVHEWLAYKIYNLVTPKSFRARLVRVTLDDGHGKKKSPFYGILLEEEHQMAKRNNCISVNRKIVPQQADIPSYIDMVIFEYLIGNTDWSVQYLQNIKLIADDSLSVPHTVPYDFDHAGLVNTPYAKPADELEMSSVRERRFRGFCIIDMKQYDPHIAFYNSIKADFYALFTQNKILDPKFVKTSLQYLDEFYETINNPRDLQKAFGYPCDKNGKGNVIIKGLKTDN